ncbi:glycosyltransferase family 2 protein [Syntrophothermus lipocalidus]|nr:glycosyltransferase family A protein [Syntrophothermus lipocalidus]
MRGLLMTREHTVLDFRFLIEPAVSVIIPAFNVERYIEEMLYSLEMQVFTDFEIIVVDDGSTDETFNIVRKYLSGSKVGGCLIMQGNSGVSVARNTGLQYARGRYVCFVDADDTVSPYYLKTLYDANIKNNTTIALCSFITLSEGSPHSSCGLSEGEVRVCESLRLMRNMLLGKIGVGCWSLLIQRELLIKEGIYFAEGYRYSEDLHFVWRALAHVDKVSLCNRRLYNYRFREGSAMAKFGPERLEGLYLMEDLVRFFEVHCPSFGKEFEIHGVARWVWATLWQAACALPYPKFIKLCNDLKAKERMKRLRDFSDVRVRLSSILFLINARAYYMIARTVARIAGMNRF